MLLRGMDDEEAATTLNMLDVEVALDALVLFDQRDIRDYPDHCRLWTHSTHFPLLPEILQLLRIHEEGLNDAQADRRLHLIPSLSL